MSVACVRVALKFSEFIFRTCCRFQLVPVQSARKKVRKESPNSHDYKLEGTQPIILQSKRSTVLNITGSIQAKEYPTGDSTSTHCDAISLLNIQGMPRNFDSSPCPMVGFYCVQTRRKVKQEVRFPLFIGRSFYVKNKSCQLFFFSLGH